MADTRPAVIPTWATDTNFASGAGIGLPTKNSPGSIAVSGWNYVFRPNPTHLNYWQNYVGQWCSWVNDTALSTDGGIKTMSDVLELQSQGITFSTLASCIIAATGGFFCSGTAQILSGCDFTFLSGADLQLNSGSRITGDPNFDGGTWNWAKPQVNESTLTNSGAGHILDRGSFALNDTGSQSIGIANGDEFRVPVLSGTLALTLLTTGAGAGARIRITAYDNIASGFSCEVHGAVETDPVVMRNESGYCSCLDLKFYGGAWHISCAVMVP